MPPGFTKVSPERSGLDPRLFDDPVSGMHAQHPGNVVFTGHSLGGGLAAATALTTGATAVTFTAAGVHPFTAVQAARLRGGGATYASVTGAADQGQIRAYRTSTDIVTGLNESSPVSALVPDAPGTHITLDTSPSPDEARATLRRSLLPSKTSILLGMFDGPAGPLVAPAGMDASALIGQGVDGHMSDTVDAAMEKRYPSGSAWGTTGQGRRSSR